MPEWFDQYQINVPLIDADHLSLFKEIARFEQDLDSDMGAEALEHSLTFLYKYVGAHFAREEQLMREVHYPHYAKHKDVHHHLKKVVYAIRQLFLEAPEQVDKEKLRLFLNDWLRNHILKMDADIAPYIEGPYERASNVDPDSAPLFVDDHKAPPHLVKVVVTVPSNKKEAIERCAFIFTKNTPEANDLEDIAISATGMSLEEALDLAAPVLKNSHETGD